MAALYRRSFLLEDARYLPRGDLIFAVLILAAPIINPWYWLWVQPFSVVYGSAWSWTASVALLMAYVAGFNLTAPEMGAYDQPEWVRWVEFGAIGLAAIFGSLRRTRLTLPEGPTRTVPGLSRFQQLESVTLNIEQNHFNEFALSAVREVPSPIGRKLG